jgi:hypothetical protein
MGRERKYNNEDFTDDLLVLIQGRCREGWTNEQIANDILHVSLKTFYVYVKQYPALAEAIRDTKETADFKVENVLYRKALEGEPWAVQMWLKNRQPSKWQVKPVEIMEDDSETGIVNLPAVLEDPDG